MSPAIGPSQGSPLDIIEKAFPKGTSSAWRDGFMNALNIKPPGTWSESSTLRGFASTEKPSQEALYDIAEGIATILSQLKAKVDTAEKFRSFVPTGVLSCKTKLGYRLFMPSPTKPTSGGSTKRSKR